MPDSMAGQELGPQHLVLREGRSERRSEVGKPEHVRADLVHIGGIGIEDGVGREPPPRLRVQIDGTPGLVGRNRTMPGVRHRVRCQEDRSADDISLINSPDLALPAGDEAAEADGQRATGLRGTGSVDPKM